MYRQFATHQYKYTTMAGRYFLTHIYNMHLMNRSSISFSLRTQTLNTSIHLNYHLLVLAPWPPLTLSLIVLMMFEPMAMLLVTTARMIIVAAKALSMNIPRASKLVR